MPPASAHTRLHQALRDYLAAVAAQKSQPAPPLAPHFHVLDTLESELAAQIDPRLRHFLESKSYRKAHDYLDTLLTSKLALPHENRQSGAPIR